MIEIKNFLKKILFIVIAPSTFLIKVHAIFLYYVMFMFSLSVCLWFSYFSGNWLITLVNFHGTMGLGGMVRWPKSMARWSYQSYRKTKTCMLQRTTRVSYVLQRFNIPWNLVAKPCCFLKQNGWKGDNDNYLVYRGNLEIKSKFNAP